MFGLPTPIDFYYMNYLDKDNDLVFEKHAIAYCLEQFDNLELELEACRKKNVQDSIRYRQKGNELYTDRKSHSKIAHQNICKLYTQSIALAPNNTEELAMGYGNRSAILFHLRKYEDCISDCDRGISMTSSDLLKAKLKYRKIESLLAMKDNRSKAECEKLLIFLEQSSLVDKMSKFIKKVKDTLNSEEKMELESTNNTSMNTPVELPAFEHQMECPCASKSVVINYNKKWGRHITATQDIGPGEIIAVEKSYFSFVYPEAMYLHCSNCVKSVLTLIPCERCIYDVYCSEKCKLEAWKKYHQYECDVFQYLWDIDKDRKACLVCIRLMLISVYEAGGISQFRNEFMSIVNNKDLRTKGFSSDGIFDSSNPKSANSLQNYRSRTDMGFVSLMAKSASNAVYYLATETNFFGTKLSKSQISTMFKNEDMVFIGAIILRNFCMLPYNGFTLDGYHSECEHDNMRGLSVHPFCSFFNHSCDPNAKYFTSKNNELVVYAKHPIKKGSQIFVAYFDEYNYDKSKKDRQDYLFSVYKFTCQCIACEQNWTSSHLKFNRVILKDKPELAKDMAMLIQNSIIVRKDPEVNILMYDNDTAKDLINILKTLAEKVTVYSFEYDNLAKYLHKMQIKTFGNWLFEVPEQC